MNKFDKKLVVASCILLAITIALGAFGAHGLKKLVDAASIASFETGVRYQMYHGIALLIIGLSGQFSTKLKKHLVWLFGLGILFFSGSIYVLALKNQLGLNTSFLGPITPIGGLLFIIGWLKLGIGVYKTKTN